MRYDVTDYMAPHFSYLLGWDRFGVAEIQVPDATSLAANPFAASSDLKGPWAGITVMALRNSVGGLVQKLKGGKRLLGKKVRITGAYKIQDPDLNGSPQAAGVSVWLKSNVKTRTAYANGDAAPGGLLGSWSPGGNVFTGTGWSLGDITALQAGDHLYLTRSGYYQIASVTNKGGAVPGPNGSVIVQIEGFFETTGSSGEWVLGLQDIGSPRPAMWMDGRAIFMRNDGTDWPGHIIRVTEPGTAYNQGEEWYCRGMDQLYGVHTDYVPRTTAPTVDDTNRTGMVLHWGPGPAQEDDKEFKISEGAIAGSDTQETGMFGVAPPGPYTGDCTDIFYLDANVWTDDPTQGDVHLMDDFTTDAGSIQYFEEIVEIPSDLDLDPDAEDIWIIVTPVRPDGTTPNFGGILVDVGVTFYAIQVELVGEYSSGGDGIEDRLLLSRLSGGLGSSNSFDGYWEQDIIRYPEYVPVRFPIDVAAVQGGDLPPAANAPYERRVQPVVPVASQGVELRSFPGGPNELLRLHYNIPLPPIPPGSILGEVRLRVYNQAIPGGANITYDLVEMFSSPPRWEGGANPFNLRKLSEPFTTSFDGEVTWGLRVQIPSAPAINVLRRHVLGVPWPQALDHVGLPSAAHPDRYWMSPSRVYINMAPSITTGAWSILLYGGDVLAWVDRRVLERGGLFWRSTALALSP
jgi:hypothetical protein